jgi:hypothetical protein
VHRVGFDNWYPGSSISTHIFRNSISSLRNSSIFLRHPALLYGQRFSARPAAAARRIFSSPWKGGWWQPLTRCSTCWARRCRCEYAPGIANRCCTTATRRRGTTSPGSARAAVRIRDPFSQHDQIPRACWWRRRSTASRCTRPRPLAVNGREYKDAWSC